MTLRHAPRVLILVASCSPLAACAPDIAFTRNGELRRVRCGTDLAFTVSTVENEGPQWSPDGNRVAYLGVDGGRRDIFLLTSSGTTSWHSHNLTAGATAAATVDFVWSPNGNWIFYTANNTNGLQSIYRVRANPPPATTVLPPMPVTPLNVNGKHPSVSPDSQRFMYSASTPTALDEFGLYTADIQGNNATLLHATPGASETMPAWGSDGRMLYVREPHSVFVIDAGAHQLLTPSYAGLGSLSKPDRPVWSPSASYIAYTGGGGKIYVVTARAPYPSQCITCGPTGGLNLDQNPQWRAGDERLVFHRPVHHIPPLSNPEGLFMIKRDGTEEVFMGVDGRRPHSQSEPHSCR